MKLHRATQDERYLDLAVRFPPVRGPARDEPRAVEAFNAAQSLPYRLAAYQVDPVRVVKMLEAASESLKSRGSMVYL